jgi:co-chaperonin GroES (HSP10)
MNNMETDVKTLNVNKKNQNSLKAKSLFNLTAKVSLSQIEPTKGKVLIAIKAWPGQSHDGILYPATHTIIRGEKYLAEVLAVGEGVLVYEKGFIITVSMYSGYHVATSDGHAKLVSDTDILTFKNSKNMNEVNAFNPATFEPGINLALLAITNAKEEKTAAGIIVNTARAESKNDAITKIGKVLKVGETNDYGKQFTLPTVDSTVIIDGHVGDRLNDSVTQNEIEYRVVMIFDILGKIKQ